MIALVPGSISFVTLKRVLVIRTKKGLFLAFFLRRQAEAIFGELPKDRRQGIETFVRSLQERVSHPYQTDMNRVQLKERQRPLKRLFQNYVRPLGA